MLGSSVLWLFLTTYPVLYSAFGMQSSLVPTLLRDRRLQAQDIGLVLATAMVVRVTAGPVVAHAADRLRRHTLILSICALFLALASVSFLLRSLAGLLCIALVHATMLAPIAPILDALAATTAQASLLGSGRGFDYGWVRAAGSAAFAVGALASGWQAGATGLGAARWSSGTLLFLAGSVAQSWLRRDHAAGLICYIPFGRVDHWGTHAYLAT